MILAYKYRIKDRSARKTLRRHTFAVNQVWNWCVAQQRDVENRYRAGAPKRKWASHFDLTKDCKGSGKDLGIHQQSVNCVCLQFTQSRDHHKRTPRFRASSGPKRALGWIPFQKQSRQTSSNTISYLGKKYRFWEGRRPLPETARGGAFVEDSRGHWFVVFHVDVDIDSGRGIGEVGIDLGIDTFASTSEGEKIDNPRHLLGYAKALATAQRARNKKRAMAIHAKIANARKDFLHKTSNRLVRENRLIVVGNVSSEQFAKTRMAKSVLDAGWSTFRKQLRYKASRHGAVFIEADERRTSLTCSDCGAASGPKGIAGLGIRAWECSGCGSVHDRDVNAAKNILALGRSVAPLVEESQIVARRAKTG